MMNISKLCGLLLFFSKPTKSGFSKSRQTQLVSNNWVLFGKKKKKKNKQTMIVLWCKLEPVYWNLFSFAEPWDITMHWHSE